MFKAIRLCLLLTFLSSGPAGADQAFITLVSTTSTENSGLLQHLLPLFKMDTGIEVRVIAVGTGQAIKNAKNGDADVLLVHHQPSEEAFVAAGYGVKRYDLMYNDFVLVGPTHDPAAVASSKSVLDAFVKIATNKVLFTSRGDDSGTHKKELTFWDLAKIDIRNNNQEWYRETGSGMGATLNTASALNAYCLTDRATWLKFNNKGTLKILFSGEPPLFNQYGIILVNHEKHPHIKTALGQAFIDWMISLKGQQAIGEYEIKGQQAFFPFQKNQ